MASELRVNTLKDASGNNSVDMSYVGPATPRYFAQYDQAVPTVNKSLNNSSISDDSLGHFTLNYTSVFSDAVYVLCSGIHENTDDADTARGGHSVGFDGGGTVTTTSAQCNFCFGASNGATAIDLDVTTSSTLIGDLA